MVGSSTRFRRSDADHCDETIAPRHEAEAAQSPEPEAIVRFFPDPSPLIHAYINSDFARALAIEYERKVRLITEEGAAVTDPASYQRVGDRLKDVAHHRREIETWFDPIVALAFRFHRIICLRRSEVLDPLTAFENAASDQPPGARAPRGAAPARGRAAPRRDRAAGRARAPGARGRAPRRPAANRSSPQQVLEQAVHAPPLVITVASTLPATKGVTTRENWQWRPVGGNTREARARAVQLVPRQFLDLNDRALTGFAKAHEALTQRDSGELCFSDQGHRHGAVDGRRGLARHRPRRGLARSAGGMVVASRRARTRDDSDARTLIQGQKARRPIMSAATVATPEVRPAVETPIQIPKIDVRQ